MARGRTATVVGVWLVLNTMLSACTTTGTASIPASQAPGGAVEQRSASPKVLTVGVSKAFTTFDRLTGAAGGQSDAPVLTLVHDYLAFPDAAAVMHPGLATALPSVDDGTWRINADGTMDTTWKLRPNVHWQDGMPFTSADVMLAFRMATDRDFSPTSNAGVIKLMDSATAPDPLTFVVHWSKTTPDAVLAAGLDPMPKHLLEDTYTNNKQALINNALLSSGFVGLGPYRLARWDPGVEIQMDRYDDFYLGRPPLDSIILRVISDGNTRIANVLAGTLDVALPPTVDLETAQEIRQRWEGTGNQVVPQVTNRLRWIRPQFRPDTAQLKSGLTLRPVRQAFLQAINREELATTVSAGFAPVADSWFRSTDPVHAQIEASIPQYPFDRARAQQLLEQAGWARGSDGVLVHQPDGERFTARFSIRPTTGADKDGAIIGDAWKSLGADISLYFMPPEEADDRHVLSLQPFAQLSSNPGDNFTAVALIHSGSIASEANRWSGQNNQGYSNPQVDSFIDRLLLTIDPTERVALHRQLAQEALGDLAVLPLYFQTDPVFMLKGVRNVSTTTSGAAWDAFHWDKA
ncbi:MAG: peptide/nickel transport system substrate-binding protein [Chloroflexota bacterium]|jgi:peptide/nickel transport system substrate-binding protein|nr:peptide/nickel transport system substrate-binding protein [Chloroflexota bacterium]